MQQMQHTPLGVLQVLHDQVLQKLLDANFYAQRGQNVKNPKLAKFNANGKRIGDSHGRAKLSDHEVELIRRMREEGLGTVAIAKKFGISKGWVSKVCRYLWRSSTVSRVSGVSITPDEEG